METLIYYLYELLFPNGKRYIGYSKNPLDRFWTHQHSLSELPVHRAVRRHGTSSIQFRVICAGNLKYIADLEIRAIAAYRARERRFGYNVLVGGHISPMHTPGIVEKVKLTKARTKPQRVQKAIEAHARPETKEKHRQAVIAAHARPDTKEKHIVGVRRALSDPDIKSRQKEGSKRGHNTEEAIENHRVASTMMWADPAYRDRVTPVIAAGHRTPSARDNHAEAARLQHANPVAKAKHSAGVARACLGTRWITNGVKNRRIREDPIPEGWYIGFTCRPALLARFGITVGPYAASG